MKFNAIATLALAQEDPPVKIAYLPQNRFDLQRSFLDNLLKQLARKDKTFTFELVSYETNADIHACLIDGTCLAALDYENNVETPANHGSIRRLMEASQLEASTQLL